MIKERVIQIIEEQFGKDAGTVKLTDSLIEDLGGDSVDTLEIALLLETEYKIDISSEESAENLIIEDLIKLVESKCQ